LGNPVRAIIVEKAEDYLFSSAKNYASLGGIIEVEVIQSTAIRLA